MLKKLILSTFMALFAIELYSQNTFSDETIYKDEWYFMPYTKGEVVKDLDGPYKSQQEKLCAILSSWNQINPPKGFKVYFHGYEKLLTESFAAYVKVDGKKDVVTSVEVALYINTPEEVLGIPVVEGIYNMPDKSLKTIVISKKGYPLYVPVTREEYLKAMIAKAEKDYPASEKIDKNSMDTNVAEMERVYRELLKTDKTAAEEFKKGVEEIKKELLKSCSEENNDYPSMLKAELSGLSIAERKSPAYCSSDAVEKGYSVAGLVPGYAIKDAQALVKVSPQIEAACKNSTGIELLVIHWQYEKGKEDGFNISDKYMEQLFNDQNIWKRITETVK